MCINAFIGEALVCKKRNSNKSRVVHNDKCNMTAATNQGPLLLKVWNLTKYIHMVTTNNKIPIHLNTYVHT